MRGLEIASPLEVGNQPGLLRLPAQHFPSSLARGGHVQRRKGLEPAKVVSRVLRGFADDRQVQSAADDLGYVSEQQPFFGDSVISGTCGTLLKGQPVNTSRIEPVHSGPAVASIPHIGRNAFFTRDADEGWNEAVIAIAVD